MTKRSIVAELAKQWCVSIKTIERWRADAAAAQMPNLDDTEGMLRWALGRKGPAPFLRRCAQLRADGKSLPFGSTEVRGAGNGYTPDTTHEELKGDWLAFTKEHSATTRNQAAQIQTLERELHFVTFALSRARERGDEAAQRKYSDEMIKFSKAVKEQKLLADKLGVESGDLIAKSEVVRIIAAHAYWTMRGTDVALDALARRLVNLQFPKDARAVLEPELLSIRFVQAYAQAVRTPAGNALPGWVRDAIRETVDNYIEGGVELHDAARA